MSACPTDCPQIECHAAEAEVGERNACVRCDVSAKPAATTVFWIVADNGSSVLAGQVTDHYWAVIKVRPSPGSVQNTRDSGDDSKVNNNAVLDIGLRPGPVLETSGIDVLE